MAWWFKHGRRQFGKKNIPSISSLQDFEDKWIQWWSAAQPQWRDTRNWPFEKGDIIGEWGDLLDGGKDGLFLIIVSLGWWIQAQDPTKEPKVNNAIMDVSWVTDKLVSRLTADAIG